MTRFGSIKDSVRTAAPVIVRRPLEAGQRGGIAIGDAPAPAFIRAIRARDSQDDTKHAEHSK